MPLQDKLLLNGKEIVVIDSAYHGYPDGKVPGGFKTILRNIDLKINPGEFICLVGPSGCGKSTLLKLITGQELVQNALRFDVLGKPVTRPDRRRGVVFQNYTLLPNLTVLENVMLGMKFQAGFFESMTRKWKRQAATIALHYLKEMRILESKFKYPSELSGGMRQRVAIAQALVTINMFGSPDILCMDEPFGALDPGTREDMQVLLLELWEKYKKTIIFVTHDLEEAVFLSTRLIVLSQFWTSDAPEEENTGARIVMDIPIDARAMSANVKKTAEFAALVQRVRNTGFNPEFRRHVDEFNESLTHPDAFQSLTVEESFALGVRKGK